MDLNKTAIVLTAHPKQQKWWRPVLLALEGYPGPLILAYDDIDFEPIPDDIVRRFAIITITGYQAGKLGHGRGELVCMRNGFVAAEQMDIDYVLKLGFDEPPWRWRNIASLITSLEDNRLDCIDCETRFIFGRPKLLAEVMQVADVATRPPGAAESYWRSVINKYNILRITERPYWEKLLGVLHLQGEYAANHGQGNAWSWTIGELWPRANE